MWQALHLTVISSLESRHYPKALGMGFSFRVYVVIVCCGVREKSPSQGRLRLEKFDPHRVSFQGAVQRIATPWSFRLPGIPIEYPYAIALH
jgi:hypothetical protein